MLKWKCVIRITNASLEGTDYKSVPVRGTKPNSGMPIPISGALLKIIFQVYKITIVGYTGIIKHKYM
jgi:hypothetical protein